MICDDVRSLVYSYLTQLRVSAVNAQIRELNKIVLDRVIETCALKERWEEWVEFGNWRAMFPERWGPDANYGVDDLMMGHNWFLFYYREILRKTPLMQRATLEQAVTILCGRVFTQVHF